MSWPFPTPKNEPSVEEGNEKPPEKTPAELIAEAVASAIKPLSDAITAQDARFKTLEDQTKPREVKPHVDPAEPISVLDDENAAFAQRMTPLLQRQLELESRIVKSDIKAEYVKAGFGDLLEEFKSDIDAMIDGAPLVQANGQILRGDSGFVRNCIDVVLGRAARKGGMRFDGKSKGFFLEPAGGSANENAKPVGDGMTEGQRRVFERMGVPKDKAVDVIKKLHFVQ